MILQVPYIVICPSKFTHDGTKRQGYNKRSHTQNSLPSALDPIVPSCLLVAYAVTMQEYMPIFPKLYNSKTTAHKKALIPKDEDPSSQS